MYAKPGDINCLVTSLDFYLSNLKCDFFQEPVLYPKYNVWHVAQAIGKNNNCHFKILRK